MRRRRFCDERDEDTVCAPSTPSAGTRTDVSDGVALASASHACIDGGTSPITTASTDVERRRRRLLMSGDDETIDPKAKRADDGALCSFRS